MINILITILLGSLFLFDWLFFVMGIGGRVMTWTPEFISVLIALSIPFRTAFSKNLNIPIKYGILLFLYLAHIGAGFLLNDISGWTMLAGLRIYTKFIPIFLVPIIYPVSEKAFKTILLLLLALATVQLPIVLWQRFFQFASSLSGDPMGGTLGGSTSGILSVFLSAVISFLVAFYFKDQIRLSFFLLFGAAAFFPMTLNETKISFVLLPMAFVFPAFFIHGKRDAIFRVLFVLLVLCIAVMAFKGIYDHYAQKRWGYGIEGFISKPDKIEQYSKRRIDPIVNAFKVGAAEDLRFAFFGRGVGNVSEGFTAILSGKYLTKGYRYNVGTTFLKLIWEVGVLGTILFFLFPFFVFLDAVRLCRADGLIGAYALGMLSLTLIFVLSTVYTFTMDANALIFPFFLLGGQLVHLINIKEEGIYDNSYEVAGASYPKRQSALPG